VQSVEKVMQGYVEAYRKLYNRTPSDLRALDNDWVIVNGARMRLSELEYLTKQLQLEYSQITSEKKNIVNRLIGWLKGP
jgi:hypothetical protein